VYSAVKKEGKPLYHYARRGLAVTAPMKSMDVFEAVLLFSRKKGRHRIVGVRLVVGSGTYVRSLAEELGRRLGCPATLSELRRIASGDYRIREARSLDAVLSAIRRREKI